MVVAVGTKNPLPSIISFINKDNKVTFVKSDEAGLPTKSESHIEDEDDEQHEDEQEHELQHEDEVHQVHFNLS